MADAPRQVLGRSRTLVRRAAAGRSGPMLLSRAVEQGALGIVTLVVARWTGADGFGGVAVLLLLYSFAVVAADHGTGMAIMSGDAGAVGTGDVRRMRVTNLAAAAAVVATAAVVARGEVGTVALGAAVWCATAEATLRKGALLRVGRARRIAGLEVAGAVAFTATALAVGAAPDRAAALVGAAFLVKVAVEVALARGWSDGLSEGREGRSLAVWSTQVLAYAVANVDFLVVGVVVSSRAFAVYALAFRVASVVTAQVAFTMGRIALVDLAAARDAAARQRVHDDRMRTLFGVGVAAALLTAAMAPLAPVLLGPSWTPVVGVVVVLAVAVPWRMTLGISGSLLLTQGQAARLARAEVGRVVVTGAGLAVAGSFGLAPFVVAVVVLIVAGSASYNVWATRMTGLRPFRPVTLLAVPALAAAVVLATAVHTP